MKNKEKINFAKRLKFSAKNKNRISKRKRLKNLFKRLKVLFIVGGGPISQVVLPAPVPGTTITRLMRQADLLSQTYRIEIIHPITNE